MSDGILLSATGRPATPSNKRTFELHVQIQTAVALRDEAVKCGKAMAAACNERIAAYNARIEALGKELAFIGEKQKGGDG